MAFTIDNVTLDSTVSNILVGAVASKDDDTAIQEADAGLIVAIPRWSRRRRKWNLSYSTASSVVEQLYEVNGCAVGFLFIPPRTRDYIATAQTIGTGDGATVNFQLKVRTQTTARFVDRNIVYPVTGTLVVYLNGTPTVAFTADYTTGIVTMTAAPTAGVVVTADFHYATPVRFTSTSVDVTLLQVDQQEARSLTIEEVFQ
jgi:uncharacterized protein (TIGR02217 family)